MNNTEWIAVGVIGALLWRYSGRMVNTVTPTPSMSVTLPKPTHETLVYDGVDYGIAGRKM